jgi:hypothetical protein
MIECLPTSTLADVQPDRLRAGSGRHTYTEGLPCLVIVDGRGLLLHGTHEAEKSMI